jgi:hypothetical protein
MKIKGLLLAFSFLALAISASAQTVPGGGGGITPTSNCADASHACGFTNGAWYSQAITGGTAAAGGSNTQLQYNQAGALAGITGVTSNGTAMTFTSGNLILAGSSSGTVVLNAPATGGGTLTLPAGTDTIVGLAATQTLTNKTLTAPTLTSPTVTGTFTATGLVTNADLANSAVTIAGNSVSLGGSLSATTLTASLNLATTSLPGIVKPDGTTITISGGVISSVGGGGGGSITTQDLLGNSVTSTTTLNAGLGDTVSGSGGSATITHAQITTNGNTNFTSWGSPVTVRRVVFNTTLTANRTATLPTASLLTAGQPLEVVDDGAIGSTGFCIIIAPTGSDVINGVNASVQFCNANGAMQITKTATGRFVADLVNNVSGFTPVTHQFLTGLGATGLFSAAQPGATDLSATGTPSSTTYLRGDNTWATPSGSGNTNTIANGTSALGTSAISSGTCATVVTTTATGVATTDTIQAGFNGDPTAVTGYAPVTTGMLTIVSYPSSGNVNFKVCNNTSASITPGAITLNWRVAR